MAPELLCLVESGKSASFVKVRLQTPGVDQGGIQLENEKTSKNCFENIRSDQNGKNVQMFAVFCLFSVH